MVRMLGWLRAAAAWASCLKRRRRSASSENAAGNTFTATSRPKAASRARYTSPIPPAPTGAMISKDPSFEPEVKAICEGHYSSQEKKGEPLTCFRALGKAVGLVSRPSTLRVGSRVNITPSKVSSRVRVPVLLPFHCFQSSCEPKTLLEYIHQV